MRVPLRPEAAFLARSELCFMYIQRLTWLSTQQRDVSKKKKEKNTDQEAM